MWKPLELKKKYQVGTLFKATGGTIYLFGSDALPFEFLGHLTVSATGFADGEPIEDNEIVEYSEEFVARCKELGVSE